MKVFNIIHTIELAYIYDKLIIKPTTIQEVNHYNTLISLGLIEYKGNNEFWLTEKGLKYYWENKG